ncbi:hypothetical protein F383_18375 [Gossypium arboreum]|uniref:Uncharacterized protein n=1 Tax=Gossypium arboreum TaxID=29729 RepID=A0A0B0NQU6_GOSAR|nr:hypothetical protein F383_18375 [Gossypium arboreum]
MCKTMSGTLALICDYV